MKLTSFSFKLLGLTTLLTAACSSDPATESVGKPRAQDASEGGVPVTAVEAAPVTSSAGDAGAGPLAAPPATIAEACTAFAAAYCSALTQKAPDIISNVYGDEASCRAYRMDRCSVTDNAPDTGWTIGARVQCTAAVPSATLQDLVMLTVPACQDPVGKKADAAACMLAAQCTSGHCRKAAGANCGACGSLVKTGEQCVGYSDCGPREDCIAGGDGITRCGPLAAVDVAAPCTTSGGCGGSRYCKGTYVPVGQNDWSVVGGTCQASVPAKIGATCGDFYTDLGNGNFELTEARACAWSNSWCKLTPDLTTGTCVALSTAGQSCGDGCAGTLMCETGTCQSQAPALCK